MDVPLQTSASTSQQEPRVGAGEGSSRGKGIATEESEALRNVEVAYETDDSDSSVEIEIERRRPRTEEQDDPTYVPEDAPSSKLARTGSGKVFSRLQAEHLRQQASGSGAEEVPTSSTAAAVQEVPVSSPATTMPITEASTQVTAAPPRTSRKLIRSSASRDLRIRTEHAVPVTSSGTSTSTSTSSSTPSSSSVPEGVQPIFVTPMQTVSLRPVVTAPVSTGFETMLRPLQMPQSGQPSFMPPPPPPPPCGTFFSSASTLEASTSEEPSETPISQIFKVNKMDFELKILQQQFKDYKKKSEDDIADLKKLVTQLVEDLTKERVRNDALQAQLNRLGVQGGESCKEAEIQRKNDHDDHDDAAPADDQPTAPTAPQAIVTTTQGESVAGPSHTTEASTSKGPQDQTAAATAVLEEDSSGTYIDFLDPNQVEAEGMRLERELAVKFAHDYCSFVNANNEMWQDLWRKQDLAEQEDNENKDQNLLETNSDSDSDYDPEMIAID